jgi:serine/threonine-protein kinase
VPGAIGRYRVLRKLGEGGMGLVFEAEDDVLGRRVAVKRLKSGDDASRRRFWREARAAARLSHPNVCQLYEVGEDSHGLFLAMELLVGEPLSQRLGRGPLPPGEVVSLGAGMLAALSALHAAGIVHRDLKPSNVYLTAHGARLLDFGLARALPGEIARAVGADSSGDRTHPDLLVGSPRYMAPEQILGQEVDARTDVFAAGAVLYEAFAGRPAFAGATLVEVLTATLHDAPRPSRAPRPRRVSGGHWPRTPPIASRPPRRWGKPCVRPGHRRLAPRRLGPRPAPRAPRAARSSPSDPPSSRGSKGASRPRSRDPAAWSS